MLAVIKGAGDIATGIAMRLWRSGIDVVMTETSEPTAIRRTVAFSDAVRLGRTTVEDVTAARAADVPEALSMLDARKIPVLVDPDAECVSQLKPDAVIDAIIAKRNTGTRISDAPIVIGIGPGFIADVDCDAVVETKRGHSLGRVLLHGSAAPNTGVPGIIEGIGEERVLRAPADGTFIQVKEIGEHAEAGEIAGLVDEEPMMCRISGVVRGILPTGTAVHKGMKAGDIDPRDNASYCATVSDKALAVGGGALEAVLRLSGVLSVN